MITIKPNLTSMISKKMLKIKIRMKDFFENKFFEIQKIVYIFGAEKTQRF